MYYRATGLGGMSVTGIIHLELAAEGMPEANRHPGVPICRSDTQLFVCYEQEDGCNWRSGNANLQEKTSTVKREFDKVK